MGLDVSSVGNHEFDEGITELLRMQYGGCHPTDGCFQQDATGKDIVFPGADLQVPRGQRRCRPRHGSPPFPALRDQEGRPGIKIGFIGMTLEGTDGLVSPAGVAGYDFTDEVKAGNAAAKILNKKGVKAIVVMIHEGGLQTGSTAAAPGSPARSWTSPSGLAPKIDMVITGHTHQPYVCNIPDPKGQAADGHQRHVVRPDHHRDRTSRSTPDRRHRPQVRPRA